MEPSSPPKGGESDQLPNTNPPSGRTSNESASQSFRNWDELLFMSDQSLSNSTNNNNNNSTSSLDPPVTQSERIKKIATRMKSPHGGLEIKDRTYHLKAYKSCFVGEEAVTWLVQNRYATSREDAVFLGNDMFTHGLLKHVAGEHEFKDEFLFYHWKPIEHYDAIIIGSGIAGLSTGYHIKSKSKEPLKFCILEAADRIGGRAFTYDLGDDIHVDLGASFVHGQTGNPVAIMATQVGLKLSQKILSPSSEDAVTYLEDGTDISKQVDKMYDWVYKKIDRRLMEEAAGVQNDHLEDRIADLPLSEKYELYYAKFRSQWKNKLKLDERTVDLLMNLYLANIESYRSGTLDTISSTWYVDNEEEEERGGDRVVVNGYSQLANHLATGLDIKLNYVVRAISCLSKDYTSQFRVDTSEGSFTCDHLIVTVSLGVLKQKSIKFNPPLPEWKTQAIDRMGYGLLDKVILIFKECFWNKNIDWLQYASRNTSEFPFFMNYYKLIQKPVLVAFISGTCARTVETMSHEQASDWALQCLEKMFSKTSVKPRELFLRGFRTNWMSNPFTHGSYSYIALGSSGHDYEKIAKKIGNLQFAGEGTNRFNPGTIHGAFISGKREADVLLHVIKKTPKTPSKTVSSNSTQNTSSSSGSFTEKIGNLLKFE